MAMKCEIGQSGSQSGAFTIMSSSGGSSGNFEKGAAEAVETRALCEWVKCGGRVPGDGRAPGGRSHPEAESFSKNMRKKFGQI